MRFIGNKEKLVSRIYEILSSKNIVGNSFFDLFSGTSNVAKFFKTQGYQVFSSDLLYFSYCLQQAYIKNNKELEFNKLESIVNIKNAIDYLSNINGVEGFIYNNYTLEGTASLEKQRMYFTADNAKKIDAIRIKIEEWKRLELLEDNEYYFLLATLVESVPYFSNISGTYGAFLKQWDKRALKPFYLKEINIISNNLNNNVFCGNSLELLSKIEADIFYLDPPYNERQYPPNYHILETIARYDNPEIRGVTGVRKYDNQKSNFCNKDKAIKELDYIAKNGKYKYLVLSYNSEGLIKQNDIIKILSKYGSVELVEIPYLRYKSNSSGINKKHINEELYILTKKDLLM